MFGFLKVQRKNLDAPLQQMYQAHFCAGCHAMVEFGGGLSSLLTNYDVTFWLWLATALEEHGGRRLPPDLKPCTAVPFRRVWVHPTQPQVRRAMAAINLALVSSKVEDNRRDGDRKVLAFAFRPLQKPAAKAISALNEMGFPAHRIQELAARQSAVEADVQAGLDDFARPTADLMGELFAFLGPLTEQQSFAADLRRVGEALGRLLYLLDALTDVEKDRKKGAFNALTRSMGYPLAHNPVSRLIHSAWSELKESLARLPLGQTAPLAEGMVEHLHGLIHQELEVWKGRREATTRWGRWRHLPLAGFFKPPVRKADDCPCDASCCEGCSGCGDGCSGCGSSCDGCGSACDCAKCDCGSSGGCNSCDTAICCCDVANCCDSCDGCCDCGETGRGRQRRNSCSCCCVPASKSPQYNVTPEPMPDAHGNFPPGVDPNRGKPGHPPSGADLLKPSGDLSQGIPRPVLDDDTWDTSAPGQHPPK